MASGVSRRLRALLSPCVGLALAALAQGSHAQTPPNVPGQEPPVAAVATPASGAGPAVAIRTKRRPGVPARSAALLMSGQQGGPIGVSALAVPLAASASGVRLLVVVDVDGATLLAGVEGRTLPVELSVYALTPEGRVGGAVTETFTLDVERAAEALAGGGIKFFGTLELAPARYALRALVRNVAVGSFGVIEVARAMPTGGEPFAFLSAPLVPEPADAWLLASESGGTTAPEAPDLLPFLGENEVPSTAPVLVGGVATRFWLLGRGVAPATSSLSVRVLDMNNRELVRAPIALVNRGESPVGGATPLLVEITLPASLPPGQYGLEVSAPSMNPDVPLWSFTRFLFADKKSAGTGPIWVRFAAPAAGAETAPPAVAFQGKGRRVKASPTIKAAYRSALRRLSADPAAARAAVTALETAALPTGSVTEWEALVLSEEAVAKELAKSNPESVLCLALLHLELQREYAQSRAYLLDVHARRMIEEFAVAYADRGGKAQAKAMAANVLASLGGNLQQPGTWGTSERLFRRALELDPHNTAALIAMAASVERIGQYQRAVDYLNTLLEVKPGDAEGRLRLAINLQRLGSHGKASELLRECTTEGKSEWVRAVAYQQIGAALLEAGSYEQAARLLAEALALFPGEEGLTMQRAYALDRLRRPVDARVLAKEVDARAGKIETSPRFRYADRPLGDLARVQEALAASTPAAREALAAALGGKR